MAARAGKARPRSRLASIRVIARVRAVEGNVALFAHGHVFRVFAARWLGLPPQAGSHFLLDTATVSILSDYRGIPAVKAGTLRSSLQIPWARSAAST